MEQKVKRQVGCLSWNKVYEGDDETGEACCGEEIMRPEHSVGWYPM